MVLGGQVLTAELLHRVEQVAPSCSRRQLAKKLCEWLNWRGPSGDFQLMSARKLLVQLEGSGQIDLPPAQPGPPKAKPAAPRASPSEAAPPLNGSLEQFEPIELVPVSGRSRDSTLSRQWNDLMEQDHYLGAGPLCGAQLRYLIRSPQGVLGAMAFSAAARRVAGREQWIGWDEARRRENLHRVVNNSRLLILPHVSVPNLASHVLAKAVARLAEDWQQRYGYRPVLLESFVEVGRFAGGCYRAANWQAIAITAGRGRQDASHEKALAPKTLWVYPLEKDFRRVLGQAPEKPRLAVPQRPPAPAPPPQDWAEEEFAQAPLGDERLVQRLCTLGRDRYARPRAPLPEACGSRAKTKAAYRFFDHPRATMPALLQTHYQATAGRVRQESVLLAVQDTTSLNYSAHPATEMLGLIGTKVDGPLGMLVHSTLAFNEAGTPLRSARLWQKASAGGTAL